MTSQSPSTLIKSDIDLGNCILYYSPSAFSSFSSAKAATTWRKFGLLKEGAQMDVTKEFLDFFSGFPARLQKRFVQAEDIRISGQMLEWNPRQVARVMGGLDITETVKATSPAPTTVATGSTKTVVNVASSSGYAVDDEIRVGNSGSYQYGRIKSISGNAITLYEGLSGDASPTTGHAVAKLDTTSMKLGNLTVPAEIGIKVVHTMPGGYGSYELYILRAQMSGNLSVAWPDNVQTQDGIGLPFEVSALSDADVEDGNTAEWIFTHA